VVNVDPVNTRRPYRDCDGMLLIRLCFMQACQKTGIEEKFFKVLGKCDLSYVSCIGSLLIVGFL